MIRPEVISCSNELQKAMRKSYTCKIAHQNGPVYGMLPIMSKSGNHKSKRQVFPPSTYTQSHEVFDVARHKIDTADQAREHFRALWTAENMFIFHIYICLEFVSK